MNDYFLYEVMNMPDPNFPIKIHKISAASRTLLFHSHWHEHLELLYFVEGNAEIKCGHRSIRASCGDLVVVNSNELHYGERVSGPLFYYCIILDISLLAEARPNSCQTKYIAPLTQNLLHFKNKIGSDPLISQCILNIIKEYDGREVGYELEIKSSIYHLLALLLRRHADTTISTAEYDVRTKNLERFLPVFKHIEANFTERVTIRQCAAMLNITDSHFCHLFKLITGKALCDYVNTLRINKAETLLRGTGLSITEIALESGFNDIHYFSRLFKRYINSSPLEYRRALFSTERADLP